MNQSTNRRQFLLQAAATGAGLTFASRSRASGLAPAEKVNLAIIGVANRGRDNLNGVRHHNIVAICDVDETSLNRTSAEFPGAKTYSDFRKLLEQKDIDAVVVSTPDHTHAPIGIAAMETGRHLYCEKPLAHSVYEIRRMIDTARKKRVITQMGTQIHAGDNYRRVVELIQSGAIGKVSEVHTWCDTRYIAVGRPTGEYPVPAKLNWDQWLGPAAERPYHPDYHPFWWRKYWAFGGGTLADMACHHMDLPFWALGLKAPKNVSAEGPELDPEGTPGTLTVHYEFPASGEQPATKLTWRHGGLRPPQFADGKMPKWGDGNLFVGEKGMLLADYGRHVLLPEADFAGFTRPEPTIPTSKGHHEEWLLAIRGEGRPLCRFDYSGPLAEAVLLGNVAYRSGKKLEWDSRRLRIKNTREADHLLHPEFRKGWEV